MKRAILLAGLVVLGVSSFVWRPAAQGAAAPPAPNPENFTGRVTGHPSGEIRTLRYSFEPGARTHWHSHEGGQVILVEQGHMRTQEAGALVREFGPRETVTTAPGVRHWHGARPDEPLTQVAFSFGPTTWMEPVTDEQYGGGPK